MKYFLFILIVCNSQLINAENELMMDPIHIKISQNPDWIKNTSEVFDIGFQCGDLFYLSAKHLKYLNYDDEDLIKKLDYYSEFFTQSTFSFVENKLLWKDEILDFMIDQTRILYKNEIRTKFSKTDGQFNGLIKKDMRACLGIIHLFESLPQKIT